MIGEAAYRKAVEKLGFRQAAYKQAFGIEGSPAYLAMIDLADYCHAFAADPLNLTDAQLREMNGRRQAFFRVWSNLKLAGPEMETLCRGALIRAAQRLQTEQGD